MSQRSEEDQAAINASRKAIEQIDALAENEAFCDFMGRLDRVTDQMAVEILEGDMTAQERNDLRHKRLGMVEVLRQPAEDRKQHAYNLENLGAGMAQEGEL
jgi:hypothetical protein